MSIGTDVLTFLAKLPPEAVPAAGRMLAAVLSGDVARAEREARATTQAVVLQRLGRRTAKVTE